MQGDGENLTAEEHKARAMLLGMIYHNNNGDDPFYFKYGEDGTPDTCSMVDAVTLEPLVIRRDDGVMMLLKRPQADRAHTRMWTEFGQNRLRRK